MRITVASAQQSLACDMAKLFTSIGNVNELRCKLELSWKGNDLGGDIQKGYLDPKIHNLFAGQQVDVLAELTTILKLNPWTELVDFHPGKLVEACEIYLPTMQKLEASYGEMLKVWIRAIKEYRKIAPQPEPDLIAAFATKVHALRCNNGPIRFCFNGTISKAGGGIIEYDLVHVPFFTKEQLGAEKCVLVPNLDIARGLRKMMKDMMRETREADQEREDKRKKSKEGSSE
jgi:hypothetical protein